MSFSELIEYPIIWLLLYCTATTVMIILMIVNKKNSIHKYKRWKTEIINLGVYKREYKVEPDEYFEQLWDENQRLQAEIKLLKKEKDAWSWRYLKLAIFVIFLALMDKLSHLFKGNTSSNDNGLLTESTQEDSKQLPVK